MSKYLRIILNIVRSPEAACLEIFEMVKDQFKKAVDMIPPSLYSEPNLSVILTEVLLQSLFLDHLA